VKAVTFVIPDGAHYVANAMARCPDEIERWGVCSFSWTLPDDPFPVEGTCIEWEVDEDGDAELTVLMSDDHAARFAVSPITSGAEWEP
jgi:hypothetical protein